MRILLVDQSLDFCAIVAAWLNEFFGAVLVESATSGGGAEVSARARSIARVASSAAPPRFLNRYVTGDQS
jgi:hypothetical protein